MNSFYSHELKKKLAYKYKISLKDVDAIVKSVFELTSKTISSGDKFNYEFKNVHVPNFGMFKVKQGRIEAMKQKYGYKDDNTRNQKGDKDNSTESNGAIGVTGGEVQQES